MRFCCCRVVCPWNGWLRRLCSTGSTRTRAMCEFAQTGCHMPTVHSCGAAVHRRNPGVEISWLSALASKAELVRVNMERWRFPLQISPARWHLRSLGNPERPTFLRCVCTLISRHDIRGRETQRRSDILLLFYQHKSNLPQSRRRWEGLSQGVPLRELSNLGQTPPSRPLIAPALAAIRRRKARLGEEVTKSICFAVAEPPPPLSVGCSQTLCPQHGHPSQTRAPVNTGSPCDHTGLGTGREENQPALLFQQVWITESILPPNLLLSSLHTVVALQPVYSHTPRGTLTSDPWWLMQLSKRLQIWRQNWLWEHSGRRFFIFTGSFA